MHPIFHITQQTEWDLAKKAGRYEAESLAAEGFIHCSTHEQVVKVANFLFKDQTGLILLVIDSGKIEHDIRYENLNGGEDLVPHIYGVLNTDAVVDVFDFHPMPDGDFKLPSALSGIN